MRFRDSFKAASQGLLANKSRSSLTILGIVIGVTAIMLVMSVGESAEEAIVGELGGLGADTVVVRPGKEPNNPVDIAEALLSDSLKDRELAAISDRRNVPDVAALSPEVFIPGSVSYRGDSFKAVIIGFSAEVMETTFRLPVARGVIFDKQDEEANARVVVIGSRVAEELFENENPIGKRIDIKGHKFRVVGVFEQRGQVVFFNADELVLLPPTTAQTLLSGIDHYAQIIVKATSPDRVDQVVADIQRTLRDLHRITDPDDDDFYLQTQQGLVAQVRVILGAFTAFLSLVIAIALVVGGIGIMNIMLVSVSERTPEIGLRKAVGATKRDILQQFLIEAILLTIIGGVIGVALGLLLSYGASIALARAIGLVGTFVPPWGAAALGIGLSGVVGIIFGIYPSLKAAKKNPIEALRYE